MNAIVGDNGVITNGQIASIESKFAGYKEELETSIVSKAEGDREKVNLLNENVKNYIPSFDENDIGRFAVIEGELYYLGDDELSKKAAKNQKMEVMDSEIETESSIASRIEEKAIDSIVKSRGKDAFEYTDENGEQKLVGIELVKKNLENSTRWKIVTETGEDGKVKNTYDEGYYYIPNGTNISGIGKTTCGYIVDYGSDDVIQYKEGTHKYFSYEDSLAVKDNLLLNLDPGTIDSYYLDRSNFTEENLGDGIKLYGYGDGGRPDFEEAFTPISFKFDGVDDYITISNNYTDFLDNFMKNGFTFEFYGKLFNDGQNFNFNSNVRETRSNLSGLFGFWSGDMRKDTLLRFVYRTDFSAVVWNAGYPRASLSVEDFFGPQSVSEDNTWNNTFDFFPDNENGDDCYFTFTLEPNGIEEWSHNYKNGQVSGKYISQRLYKDGNLKSNGLYKKEAWDKFGEDYGNDLKKFCVGACHYNSTGIWFFSHMECYSLRFYSRALTSDEVHDNYEKTIEYHKILENQNKE